MPLFPAGTTHLNASLAFECRDGQVSYFNGHLPVFTHAQDDWAAFRLFTRQLIVKGTATGGEIRRAFGVPKIAVPRAVALYRAGGAAVVLSSASAPAGAQAHARRAVSSADLAQ